MLSQDEKRILLAKHFGWTDIHGGPPEGGAFWRGANPKRPLALKEEIPDYFADLNKINKIERSLPLDKRSTYWQRLLQITEKGRMAEPSWLTMTASAEHRAEALGQILNLW